MCLIGVRVRLSFLSSEMHHLKVYCVALIIGKGVHVLSSMVHRVYVFGKLNVKTDMFQLPLGRIF